MFNERKIDQLKLLYDIFQQIEITLKYIIAKFKPFISKEGMKIIQNHENLKDPIGFSTKLLEKKAEMDDIVSRSFSNGIIF